MATQFLAPWQPRFGLGRWHDAVCHRATSVVAHRVGQVPDCSRPPHWPVTDKPQHRQAWRGFACLFAQPRRGAMPRPKHAPALLRHKRKSMIATGAER